MAGGLAAAVPASAAPTSKAQLVGGIDKVKREKPGDKLGAADRQRLAEAVTAGQSIVTVMVTTTKGDTDRVAGDLRAMGAYVRYQSARLGYLSAAVATAKVEKAAAIAGVRAVDLDEVVELRDPATATGASTGTAGAPSAATPDDNPFMPTRETGSVAFKVAHPSWDGRGVTIGILDSGVDLDNPALRTTSTGETKIVDWFTATDPVTEGPFTGGDASWLPMLQDATGPKFPKSGTYRDSVWRLPKKGTFKIRTMDESGLSVSGCELCDANRDGDNTDRIGALYEPSTHKVWVDTDDDKDFTDETAMLPYKASGQVGHIGADNPATDVHEAIPFVVDYREHLDYSILGPSFAAYTDVTAVDIGISSGEHGSHVAGIAAANDMFGGQMDGQAPGAKLVSARACTFGPGCTSAALTDGMAKLAEDGVDIINMSIGGLPALNDGNNARTELYNRIINDLGVQIVISAGNSSNALNTIGDPSVASDVVSVGADITKATWKSNYGSDVGFSENIMPFSSGGPREDGGFKPNITAPGAAIATINMWLPGSPVAEAGYSLPAGYAMLQGTSMASPQATGAMALLLSAAKQAGVSSRSPDALRRAVYSTAQWNSSIPAFLQGHGQIDVPGAWNLLRTGLGVSTIETTAPVCTEIWKLLGETTGTGLYNRCAAGAGGPKPGKNTPYQVTLKRTTGAPAAGSYRLRLRGSTSSFSVSPSVVSLPLNQEVTVTVSATVAAGTAASAVLDIDDPKTAGLDGSMMAVVAAGQDFPASYTVTKTGTSRRNETQRFYVTVPSGVTALELAMSGLSSGSQTRFLAFHPYGVPVDPTSTPSCYANYGSPAGNGCNPAVRTYVDPVPGVWEVLVESRRTSPLLDNPFTLTAKLLGATVSPETVTLASVQTGVPTAVEWSATNQLAAVTAHTEGGPLGSVKADRPSIADGAVQTYTVTVPQGAARLDVRIGNTSDTGADLDLYVSGPSGDKQAADGDSEEKVSYANPIPGDYTVTVDGYAVPAGSTDYDYVDVFFADSLGSLTVEGTPFSFGTGATRAIAGTVTALQAADAGRSLFGEMRLVSDAGALLGTGEVKIGSVS